MERIILNKCDDGKIWVTSDDNLIGTESSFKTIQNENERFLIALAEFLGYEPAILLNLEDNEEDYYEDSEFE